MTFYIFLLHRPLFTTHWCGNAHSMETKSHRRRLRIGQFLDEVIKRECSPFRESVPTRRMQRAARLSRCVVTRWPRYAVVGNKQFKETDENGTWEHCRMKYNWSLYSLWLTSMGTTINNIPTALLPAYKNSPIKKSWALGQLSKDPGKA